MVEIQLMVQKALYHALTTGRLQRRMMQSECGHSSMKMESLQQLVDMDSYSGLPTWLGVANCMSDFFPFLMSICSISHQMTNDFV